MLGWKILFNSTWGRFQTRFDAILKSLEKHAEIVDREANAIDIVEAKAWRDKYVEDCKQREEERAVREFIAVLSWLDPAATNSNQEQELQRLLNKRHLDTCDWLLDNTKIKKWVGTSSSNPVLWLHGPPGAGMAPKCSAMHTHSQGPTLRYIRYFSVRELIDYREKYPLFDAYRNHHIQERYDRIVLHFHLSVLCT